MADEDSDHDYDEELARSIPLTSIPDPTDVHKGRGKQGREAHTIRRDWPWVPWHRESTAKICLRGLDRATLRN